MPPGQATMVDTWSDYTGGWADVYDDDHEEMQAWRPTLIGVGGRAVGGA